MCLSSWSSWLSLWADTPKQAFRDINSDIITKVCPSLQRFRFLEAASEFIPDYYKTCNADGLSGSNTLNYLTAPGISVLWYNVCSYSPGKNQYQNSRSSRMKKNRIPTQILPRSPVSHTVVGQVMFSISLKAAGVITHTAALANYLYHAPFHSLRELIINGTGSHTDTLSKHYGMRFSFWNLLLRAGRQHHALNFV